MSTEIADLSQLRVWTIYKETGSANRTTIGASLALAFAVTLAVAQFVRWLGYGRLV